MRSGSALAALVVCTACWSTATTPVAKQEAKDLTTVDAVLEASVAAQGGRERLAKIRATKSVGTLTTPHGIAAKLTMLAMAPRSLLVTIAVPGLGVIRQGVSGDVVWEVSTKGARILTGSERAQQLREATFPTELDWRTAYLKVTLNGVVDRDGVRAYKLTYVTREEDVQTEFYAYDTHLQIAEERLAVSQLGTIPVVTTFSDYRDVGGTKHPFKVYRTEGPSWMEITLDSMEVDPVIEPGTFDLPAEVAALQ